MIPRAIDYFTGKALEWEDDDGEDDFDEDDEFDDDEDEDDNESDDDVPASRRKPNKGNNVDPQECKQQ